MLCAGFLATESGGYFSLQHVASVTAALTGLRVQAR